MNKTLLLIICDFLLISILALVEFKPAEQDEVIEESAVIENNAAEMLELMQLSLEHESAQREQLNADLEQRTSALEETSGQLEQVSATLQQTAQAKEQLEATTLELSQSLEATRSDLSLTAEEKERIARELEQTRQRTARLQEELQREQQRASGSEEALQQAEENLRSLEAQQSTLQTELRVRDTEREMLQQNLLAAQAEVERARIEAERAQQRVESLTQGVSDLAASSTAMQQEIRQAQPLSMNAIYQRFLSNRLPVTFSWEEQRLFGSQSRQSQVHAVVVRHNGRHYALFSTVNTPLNTVADVGARMTIGERAFAIAEVTRLAADQGIATVSIPADLVEEAGLDAIELAADPLRFPDVVLISDSDAAYGEIPVRVPADEPGRLLIESRFINRLFGEYSPQTGNFVFSKSGRLIGVMVAADRAIILENLRPGSLQTLR